MANLFKCIKCGKQLGNKHEQEEHEKDCKGISFTMDIIEKLAKGESLDPKLAFDCVICGESQEIDDIRSYNKGIPGVCDNCISDLKDIILTKRKKKNGTV